MKIKFTTALDANGGFWFDFGNGEDKIYLTKMLMLEKYGYNQLQPFFDKAGQWLNVCDHDFDQHLCATITK